MIIYSKTKLNPYYKQDLLSPDVNEKELEIGIEFDFVLQLFAYAMLKSSNQNVENSQKMVI